MRQWLNGWSGPASGGGGGGGVAAPGGGGGVPGGGVPSVGPTRGIDDKQSTLSRSHSVSNLRPQPSASDSLELFRVHTVQSVTF